MYVTCMQFCAQQLRVKWHYVVMLHLMNGPIYPNAAGAHYSTSQKNTPVKKCTVVIKWIL